MKCHEQNPSIEITQQPDLGRREFLRQGAKLAYIAPVIITLTISTDSAAYNGAGKCPEGWDVPNNSHYGEC
jgi:hypothetical protein